MPRQLAMQTEYARQLQKSGEENRRLTHDFRQHLRAAMGISAQVKSATETEEKQQELLGYLEQVAHNMTMPHPSHAGQFCRNVAADALLQYYYATAVEDGVAADFRLLLPEALPLNDVGLCTVLGNLLENAVDACRRQEYGRKYIRVATEQAERALLLLVENSCDGGYRQACGRFLSRKQGEMRFSVGLESVHNILERHGGTLDIYPVETRFRVGIFLPLAD